MFMKMFIIGVLDSAIWPASESFSDKDFGPIPKKWKGVCHGGKNFTCNKKLTGARFYPSSDPSADSAIDTQGHEQGKSINSFKINGTEFPLVSGKDVTRKCDEQSARYCYPGCLDNSLVRGKIVIYESTKGIKEAALAGAIGTIAKSGTITDVSFVVPMPASVLITSDLKLVQDYANSTKLDPSTSQFFTYLQTCLLTSLLTCREAKAFISTSEYIKNNDAPLVASFSSRGPKKNIPDIPKARCNSTCSGNPSCIFTNGCYFRLPLRKRSVNYNVLSGTSMSCRHAAGASAFVKLAHPDWSPSAIKSALMTTAWSMDPRKHKDAEFSYGAGHISPVNATNPGLVYETSSEDYIKMLCNMGYSSGSVKRLFRNRSIDCSKLKQVEETSKDLNYPSMAFKVRKSPILASFSRTVTNVGFENSIYIARISKPSGMNITVEPQTLAFKHLNEKKSFIVTVKGHHVRRSMISASLVWSDGVHFVRSPIVVY